MPATAILLALAVAVTADVAVSRQAVQMGTYSDVTVWAPDRARGLELAGAAFDAIEEVEGVLSTWRESSEVSALNQAAVGTETEISPILSCFLGPVFDLARETGYAFDPGIGALTEAWGIHGDGQVPRTADIAGLRLATGTSGWRFSERPARLCRLHSAARLDVGGFGKGIGLDHAARSLIARGVSQAILDLGGQALALGGPFPVGIAHPSERSQVVAVISLRDASIATSGNSERSVTHRGRRIGHILDPHSGQPAPDFGSVAVVAPSGLEADVLSTALFVLGPDAGLELLRSRPGIEALFLLGADAPGPSARCTPGMRPLLHNAHPDLQLRCEGPDP